MQTWNEEQTQLIKVPKLKTEFNKCIQARIADSGTCLHVKVIYAASVPPADWNSDEGFIELTCFRNGLGRNREIRRSPLNSGEAWVNLKSSVLSQLANTAKGQSKIVITQT